MHAAHAAPKARNSVSHPSRAPYMYAAHLFPLCLLLLAECRQRDELLFRKAGPIRKSDKRGFPVQSS